MSDSAWVKRKIHRLECPSGAVCYVRRPSPEVSIKGGRLIHIFSPRATSGIDETSFTDLNDEEAAKVYIFARAMVLGTVVTPKLSVNPDGEDLTPEDLPPADFWHVFSWAIKGGRDLPVELKEGETTVDAVETFPEEQGAIDISSGDSEPAAHESSGLPGYC